MSWNVNGISHLLPKRGGDEKITSFFNSKPRRASTPHSDSDSSSPSSSQIASPLRKFLKRHEYPDIVCLQEVHISTSDSLTQNAVRRAANPESGDEKGVKYEVYFALPRDRWNARGLGGKGRVHGVCTLVRTDLKGVGDTKSVDWDLEGRVLITSLPQHKLVIINGYWPNGTTHPYRDSRTGEVVGSRHDFKRRFHERMLEEVKGYERDGWEVVLVGDMNIAPQPVDG